MSTNNTSQNYEISPESESIESMNEVPKVTKTVKKEKNPNRVAAGKRLAEYNRKQKEKLLQSIKPHEPKEPAGSPASFTPSESTSSSESNSFNSMIFIGIGIAVFGLAVAKFYNSRKKSTSPTEIQDTKVKPESDTQNNIFDMN